MKKISFTLLLLLCSVTTQIFAVSAVPWPVEKQQPDGTKITVYLKGDERVHWMESLDGYTLMYDSQRNIVYAEKDTEGNMVPSNVIYESRPSKAKTTNEFLSGIKRGIRYSSTQIQMFNQIWEVERSEKKIQKSPITGEKKALCILVGFKNKAFSKTVAEFENLMNQVGYNQGGSTGSVKDFYWENSYGQMDFTVDIVGPYTLKNNISYYAANDYRYLEFAEEAIKAADTDVDFREYANSYNQLETVHLIFAGYGDEAIDNGKQIWSHKWELYPSIRLDGIQISTYSCSPELRGSSGNNITSIGVICHELCHVFGAPDYYDVDYDESGGEYPGTGEWDLMAGGSWNNNGNTPAHINMFQKILFGWVNPTELTEPETITEMLNSAENPVAYTIEANSNGEMYVLENRQQIGFDSGLPGHGLLIYHIHSNALGGNADNSRHPQQAYVIAANSRYAIPSSSVSSYGSIDVASAPFGINNTSFTGETTPRMFYWSGNSGIGIDKPLTDIKDNNYLVSFDFMGGLPKDICQPVTNLTATINDETVTLSWTAPKGLPTDSYTYSIYQDKQLLASEVTKTTYSAQLEEYKTYNFCVTATCNNELTSKETCIEIDYFNPNKAPLNFVATQSVRDVVLTWTTPAIQSGSPAKVIEFHIHKNNDKLISLSSEEYSFTDTNPEIGRHTYTIIADYGNEKISDPVTTDIEVVYYDPCIPVKNLQLGMNENIVSLNWDALPHITGYKIYRNNEVIAETIKENSFSDILLVSGKYNYCVITIGEECKSATACKEIDFIYPCDVYTITDVKDNLKGNKLTLTWDLKSADNKHVNDPKSITFNIYEQDKLIASDISEKTYTIQLENEGQYEYNITYSDQYCESSPATIEVTYAKIPFAVAKFTPEAGAKEVDINTVISVTFNQEIEKADLGGISINHGNTSYENITAYIAGSEIIIENSPLLYETEYTISFPYGVIETMEPFSWSFTTVKDLSSIPTATNELDILVYPNPSEGPVTIKAPENSTIGIYDISGKIVKEHSLIGTSLLTINLPGGIYFIKAENNNRVVTSKLIIKSK